MRVGRSITILQMRATWFRVISGSVDRYFAKRPLDEPFRAEKDFRATR